MNDEELDRCLKSIGKACFANYYELFADMSLSNKAVAAAIVGTMGYPPKATRTFRVSPARRIIRAGRDTDACRLIAQSEGVDAGARERARVLAMALSQNPRPLN
jgi:hypothetical protein